MILTLAALALAAPEAPPPDLGPAEIERDLLRAELEGLKAELVRRDEASEALAARAQALEALLGSAEVLLDDRRPAAERVAAAERMAVGQDPRALPFLRAAAGQPDPEVRRAAALAALRFPGPDHAEPARVLLSDRRGARPLRLEVIGALGDHQTPEAARALWDVGSDEAIEARIRARALDEVRDRYPDTVASFGAPPPIADALGATTFVAAGGLAGGILMSSLGVLGQIDGGPALGAVGGSAVGLGAGGLYAATRPVTAGDGLAFASGVSFGLTYGLWTTTAVHGAWRTMSFEERDDVVAPAAGWRALGVLGGGAVGLYAVSRNPTAWNVLEVDTAGYLGSGIALGAAGLLLYHPPEDGTAPVSPTTAPRDRGSVVSPRAAYDRRASQELAVAELIGATAGLATGTLLTDRWELGMDDALLASVLAAQGGWVGAWTPPLLVVQRPEDVKGNIRLPTHAFGAAGLVIAEVVDVGPGRSLSTAFGAGVGNALGAGLPMVVGYDDDRSIAAWMIPLGLVGTAGGFVAEPLLDPSPGDAALTGVSTLVAGSAGALVGEALGEHGVWIDDAQATGVGLLSAGAAGVTTYALARSVEPRVDEVLVVGSAAAWGAGYGALVPVAAGASEATVLWSTAGTELAFTGASALLVQAGLRPRSVVVPELLGVSGGTLGSLIAGLGTARSEPVALGAVIGATAGLGIGALVEGVKPSGTGGRGRTALRSEAVLLPRFGHELGAGGEPVPTVGFDLVGW